MKINIVKTKRLILRSFEMKDLDDLVENINNKKITKHTSSIPHPYTKKDGRKWLNRKTCEMRKKEPGSINLAIVKEGKVIGSVSLVEIEDHKVEVGYWLAEKHWGKGFVTEALQALVEYSFNKLELKRLYGKVYDFNIGSQKVLKKCGFKKEGELKKDAQTDEGLVDCYLYGLVRY